MSFDGAFAARYAYAWCLGLLATSAAALYWTRRGETAPQFDFGGFTSVVALRSLATGKYLEVSLEDGLLRASGSSPLDQRAQFRALVLGASTVKALRIGSVKVSHAAETWDPNVKMVTKGGCRCSGFSNEHGLGRFCHPWENEWQAPWCYVDDSCPSATVGSFFRPHAECPQSWYSQGIESLYNDTMPYNASQDWGEVSGAGRWQAPSSCPCSGVQSAIGYGSYCKGWEYPGQTPWCYVFDNCSLASASGNAGSFGNRYIDCVYDVEEPETIQALPSEANGRQLSAKGADAPPKSAVRASGNRPAAVKRWGQADERRPLDAMESALLEGVQRLKQPYVALLSAATEGFVTVELCAPPQASNLKCTSKHSALASSAEVS